MRFVSCLLCCALFVCFARAGDSKSSAGEWVTIKGRVVFPEGKAIPKRQPLQVQVDRQHCLAGGALLDESVLVNDKNRGIKNVVVYLRPFDTAVKGFPRGEIHPGDSGRKPAEVEITQPCCMFVNRVATARVGDTLVVKNPAPVAHNFFWSSQENGNTNVTIPAGESWKMPKALVAENIPISYKCSIHPWMSGYVRVFDHPYSAVTDEDGNFEIKNAPAGKYRIVYWHENGVRGGKEGRFGNPILIAGPKMEMKPIEFDVSAR
jgi:hypothetical protein